MSDDTSYDFISIEKKWEDFWEKQKIYAAPKNPKDKLYILPQLPYPSGSNLHVGHAEVYSSCDIYARAKRMQGKDVLQVIGWDAFGLPAENFAIKNNVHPRIKTNESIDNYRYLIKRMGISVDWDRAVGSHEPSYYKWTQWFFLLMYKQGLAYRKMQTVNWCEGCKTVLANEQVIDGLCERCETVVLQKEMEQWYFKITEYADRLYDDLDKVDWPKETVINQRNWIGRKHGLNIHYAIKGTNQEVVCFTTRPDTNFGATFVVVGPEHELVSKLLSGEFSGQVDSETIQKVKEYVATVTQKTERERLKDSKDKSGVSMQLFAINGLNGREMPVYVADYVLGNVGTGAVVGVPGHDKRDFEFAKKFNLPVVRVVVGEDGDRSEITSLAQVQEESGTMVNSEFLDGMPIREATEKMMDYHEEKGLGERVVTYKLRDWSISRQRFWGAPIPMVYDDKGELHPVTEEDLPVILPDDVDFIPTGRSPLTYSESFQEGVEEKYGKGWTREVDTLDTFMCSSWYYFRYIDPHNDEAFASKEAIKNWMPVDFYIGGPEHTNGHLLYSRFFTKVLFDAGYIDFDEPFLMHRHQGLILGEDNRKMSKRWGNVINPDEVMDRHGADTLRMYEMFMGPLSATKAWNTRGEAGVYRFVIKIWETYANDSKFGERTSESVKRKLENVIKKVTDDIDSLKFNTAVASMMEFMNLWTKDGQKMSKDDAGRFLKLLAPFAPYITEELWSKLGIGNSGKISIHLEDWPVYDEAYLGTESVPIVVQINGKVRSELSVLTEDAGNREILEKLAREDAKVIDWIGDSPIKKVIVVSGRLVNIVI